MPNRYLRASYVESERINSVTIQAECVWAHLLVTVDDFGRTEAHPKILRPKLFPLRLDQIREADLQRCLAECEKAGLVRLYVVDGKQYLQMEKWEQGRAEKSRYPPPPTSANKCSQVPTNVSGHPQMLPAAPDPDPDPDSGTDTDSDPEGEARQRAEPPVGRAKFVKPEAAELLLAVQKAGMPDVEASKFMDFYESNGWRVGKNPMRSWRGAVGTWKARWEERRNGHRTNGTRSNHALPPTDHMVADRDGQRSRRDAVIADEDAHRDDPPPV